MILLITLSMLVLLGCVFPIGSAITGQTTKLLTIAQVCELLPGARGNKRVSPSTATRWILKGCPSRSGVRVKLKASRGGGRWLVAPDDLEAFFAALAATDVAAPPPTPQSRTETQRHAASERAARELERRGA